MRGGNRLLRNQLTVWSEASVVGAEAVDDAAFLEVVGSHLHFDTVTGENSHFVHSHSSCQMTEELVVLGFVGGDANAECSIRIAFLDLANELNNVLRH